MEIYRYLNAGYPAVAIETVEEFRIIEAIALEFWSKEEKRFTREIRVISSDQVLRKVTMKGNEIQQNVVDNKAHPFHEVFAEASGKDGQILIILDYHRFIQDAVSCRRLKACFDALKVKIPLGSMFILIAPVWSMPAELKHDIPVLQMPLPNRGQLLNALHACSVDKPFDLTGKEEEVLLNHAAGLTLQEAESAFGFSMVGTDNKPRKPDPDDVLAEKIRLIKQSGFLSVCPSIPMSDVGGLGQLKRYVERRILPTLEDPQLRVRGLLMAGISGCLHGDTPIYDPVDHTCLTVRQRWLDANPFSVISLNRQGKPVIARAEPAKNYGPEEMIEFMLDDGSKITVTPEHRFWDGSDYVSAASVYGQLQLISSCLPLTTLDIGQQEFLLGVEHSIQRGASCQGDYQGDPRSHGGQPRSSTTVVLEYPPSLSDAQPYNHRDQNSDGQVYECECNPSALSAHQPTLDSLFRAERRILDETKHLLSEEQRISCAGLFSLPSQLQTELGLSGKAQQPSCIALESIEARASDHVLPTLNVASNTIQQRIELFQKQPQSLTDSSQIGTSQTISPFSLSFRAALDGTPYMWDSDASNYKHLGRIVQARMIGRHDYFDFHVPVFNNYWAMGLFHHNTGKSLSTRAISSVLGWPVLAASLAQMKGRFVGDSERNITQMLKTAEAVAPVVLRLDEVEKGVGGYASSAQTDGGTLLGMVGLLLTWLAEHQAKIITVMTCNNYKALPPELTNAHRMDECFFVDLPTQAEREQIAKIHLKRLGLKENFSWVVSEMTEDWTGAEIEKLIKETAAYTNRKPEGEDFATTKSEIRTFAQINQEEVAKLREWGIKNMRVANTLDVAPSRAATAKSSRVN